MAKRIVTVKARSPRASMNIDAILPTETPREESEKSTSDPPVNDAPVSRISVNLTPDGAFDLDGMRKETRERLARAMQQSAPIVGAASTDTTVASMLPMLTPLLVDLINKADMLLIERMTHAPREMIGRLAKFTPEESKSIEGPLLALVNKYAPTWTSKYDQELAFVAMVSFTTFAKLQLVQAEMARTQNPSSTVTPESLSEGLLGGAVV